MLVFSEVEGVERSGELSLVPSDDAAIDFIFALIADSSSCGERPLRKFACEAQGDGEVFGEPEGVWRGERLGEGRGNSSSASRSAAATAAGDKDVGDGDFDLDRPLQANGFNEGALRCGLGLATSGDSLIVTFTFEECSLSTSSTRTRVLP